MAKQLSLIPVSPAEVRAASFNLAMLLQQREEEKTAFKEVTKEHKETMTVLDTGIAEHCEVLLRAKREQEEGLASAQVDALLNQTREQS